jgi:hypothetical protein
MNFIKKIFEGKIDDSVHLHFQKFSKGEFKNRALINAKNSGKKYTISTTAEFANDLVRTIAKKLGGEKGKITGAIISTSDLTGELDFKDKKQFQGVKKYIIDKEMSGEEITALLEKFPKAFFALSFNAGEHILKIKAKAPKSGKPGKKGEEKLKPDFCKLVTTDSEIGKDFVFEKPDFKQAEINHTFLIEEIIVPEELKSSDDFARIREESKRKGKIIREAIIDSQKIKTEKEFVA